MTKEVQIVPDKIQIRAIRILGGNITSDPSVALNKVASYQVHYGASDELSFEEKLFKFVLNVNINALDSADNEMGVSGQYTIEYVFHIANLEDYVAKADHVKKFIEFHHILPSTLLSIVYSTSRGIILSRTQGTVLDGVILPVIDIYQFVKSMEEGKRLSEKSSLELTSQ